MNRPILFSRMTPLVGLSVSALFHLVVLFSFIIVMVPLAPSLKPNFIFLGSILQEPIGANMQKNTDTSIKEIQFRFFPAEREERVWYEKPSAAKNMSQEARPALKTSFVIKEKRVSTVNLMGQKKDVDKESYSPLRLEEK